MRWFLLFLLLLTFWIEAKADCCSYQVFPIMDVIEVPSMERFQYCDEQGWCDQRIPVLLNMIRTQRNNQKDSVEYYFNKLNYNSEFHQYDELDFDILFLYAKIQVYFENIFIAKKIYEKIKESSNEGETIRLLAEMKLSRILNNEKKNKEIAKQIEAFLTSNRSREDTYIVLYEYSGPESLLDLCQEFKRLLNDPINDRIAYQLVSRFILSSVFGCDISIEEIKAKYQAVSEKNVDNGLEHYHYTVLSKIANVEGKYIESLEFAQRAVEMRIGPVSNNDELVNEILNFTGPYDGLHSIMNFANSKLFLTRVGKGLDPVKESFDLYVALFKREIQPKLLKSYGLVSSGRGTVIGASYNLLVIGNYLYEQTGDLTYLQKAISAIDISTGSGVYTRVHHKSLMRKNRNFAARAFKLENLYEKTNKQLSTYQIDSEELYQQLIREEESLRDKYSEHYQKLTNGYEIDLIKFQEEMAQADAATVGFSVSAAVIYRFYLDADTIFIRDITDDAQRLNQLIQEIPSLRQQSKQANALQGANRELYQLLLGDLDSLLPPRIHIVVNGFLGQVSFSSLRMDTEGTPRYLGVEHAISRQFSIKTMQMLQEAEMDPDKIGVLGFAPAFENELVDASELRQAGFMLPPLTYNQEELRSLAEKSSGKFYYGDQATLEHYQDKAPKYNILHLATHAISSEVEGLNSRVYLLDNAAEPASLRAADVSLQPLRAELVTLSACETGGGGINYVEGRIGLTKAFIAAGARSVVSSNWAVDDHATAELMDYFYTATKEGQSPDLALQHARKSYLEAHPGASPALWAAFEAYGGMVAPQWKEKADWWQNSLYYLLAVLLIVIGGFSLKKMRHA